VYSNNRQQLILLLVEYEFFQFKAPPSDPNAPITERNNSSTARFLRENPVNSLPSLTEGMFGYSLTRPVHNKDYYYEIFDACEKFRTDIEGWHTESGPGVFEAALAFGEIQDMADRAGLFKYVFTFVVILNLDSENTNTHQIRG
jgi:glutamine synthetase